MNVAGVKAGLPEVSSGSGSAMPPVLKDQVVADFPLPQSAVSLLNALAPDVLSGHPCVQSSAEAPADARQSATETAVWILMTKPFMMDIERAAKAEPLSLLLGASGHHP
jgi:hypothetical protein